jgi:hypothetical protein
MTNFESRRITISHFAAVKVCELLNVPLDCKPQTLGSAVEQLIFELGYQRSSLEEKAKSHQ